VSANPPENKIKARALINEEVERKKESLGIKINFDAETREIVDIAFHGLEESPRSRLELLGTVEYIKQIILSQYSVEQESEPE
jgi:hypothetical protein